MAEKLTTEQLVREAAAICADRNLVHFAAAEYFVRVISRLRKAEEDNANMAKLLSGYHQICSEAGIAPATSEIYAAADRSTQGGGNG